MYSAEQLRHWSARCKTKKRERNILNVKNIAAKLKTLYFNIVFRKLHQGRSKFIYACHHFRSSIRSISPRWFDLNNFKRCSSEYVRTERFKYRAGARKQVREIFWWPGTKNFRTGAKEIKGAPFASGWILKTTESVSTIVDDKQVKGSQGIEVVRVTRIVALWIWQQYRANRAVWKSDGWRQIQKHKKHPW